MHAIHCSSHLRRYRYGLLFLSIGMFTPWLDARGQEQSTPQRAPTAERSQLPEAWLGRWQGTVTQQTPIGDGPSFNMRLDIAREDSGVWIWDILYDGTQGTSERNYQLVSTENSGEFKIDEKNGIVIDAALIGQHLCCHFALADQTIWTTYELVLGDPEPKIHFELYSASEDAGTQSGGANEMPNVNSLRVSSRQSATLIRVPEVVEESAQNMSPRWRKLETEAYRGKQDDIVFVNENVGWYVNGDGKIFKTIDGGEHWTLQLHQPGTFFRCIAFLDELHGFAGNIGPDYFPNVSDAIPLYETSDGGVNWTPVTSIAGEPVVGLCALQVLREPFINAGVLDTKTTLIGVGRVGGPAIMIVSEDLGKTWSQKTLGAQAAMALDVHFFNQREGFVAAASDADVSQSNALILATQDGGTTWTEAWRGPRTFELTWKMSFPSRNVGYVTIQSYNPDPKVTDRFVAKTIDGGRTWQELPLISDPRVRAFGIAFLDESIGWVGAVPQGFQTLDGGANWIPVDMGNAVNKIRIVKGDGKRVGYAIGVHVHRIDWPDGQGK